MTTTNKAVVHCIIIPLVFWGIHLGWVFGFPLTKSIIPYDYMMYFALLGLVFPIIGTIYGVYWSYIYFLRTKKGIFVVGLLLWIICLVVFAIFVLFGTSNTNKEYAPSHSETIYPGDKK
jgi:hypothetical protein